MFLQVASAMPFELGDSGLMANEFAPGGAISGNGLLEVKE